MKKGLRALGVAESFRKGESKLSVMAGVVMRRDLVVDGFNFAFPTVGGMDATEKLIELYTGLSRKDINFLIVSGCVISWFNVIDLEEVYVNIGIPVICVTYEESEGLDRYFMRYFPDDWTERARVYRRNGDRVKITLKTGHEVFVRGLGISLREAINVLNAFTLHGKHPEPVRVARLLARSLASILLDGGLKVLVSRR